MFPRYDCLALDVLKGSVQKFSLFGPLTCPVLASATVAIGALTTTIKETNQNIKNTTIL
jgi:hypothetical protein